MLIFRDDLNGGSAFVGYIISENYGIYKTIIPDKYEIRLEAFITNKANINIFLICATPQHGHNATAIIPLTIYYVP